MTDIEELLWQQASKKLFIPKEQYLEQLRTFTIDPVERDGVLICVFLRKDAEFHMVTFKAGKPITRKILLEAFEPQFSEYGYLETKTPKVYERQHRFNKALGFVQTGEDEFNVHYRLDRDAVTRSSPCPSSP